MVRFAHVVERFQRAPEVGVRMPPGSDAVDRVPLESILGDDPIPDRAGVAHLFDEWRRVAGILGHLKFEIRRDLVPQPPPPEHLSVDTVRGRCTDQVNLPRAAASNRMSSCT